MKPFTTPFTALTTGTALSRRQMLRFGMRAAVGIGVAAVALPLRSIDTVRVGATYPDAATPLPPKGTSLVTSASSASLVSPYSSSLSAASTSAYPAYLPLGTPTAPPQSPGPVLVGPSPKYLPVPLPFEAYHGVTGAEHQNRFNNLGANGYRLISLSISGATNDPRYAAVWVQRAGPAQRAVHGVTAAEYQQWFDAGVVDGFAPTIVSATGPAASARFAAVSEAGVTGNWVARHNIDADAFDLQTVQATSENMIPRSVAIYGDPSARRYAGVWQANTKSVDWPSVTDVTVAQYQQTFDSLTSRSYRPRYMAVAGDGHMAAVFGSDSIGNWVARHNLTSAQYQQAFTEYTGGGMVPVCVEAGGMGSDTRYAAIFVTQAAVSLY